VGERIAWVPGVTIDQGFRIRDEAAAWVATVTDLTDPRTDPIETRPETR
jgi:hypothetical protein